MQGDHLERKPLNNIDAEQVRSLKSQLNLMMEQGKHFEYWKDPVYACLTEDAQHDFTTWAKHQHAKFSPVTLAERRALMAEMSTARQTDRGYADSADQSGVTSEVGAGQRLASVSAAQPANHDTTDHRRAPTENLLRHVQRYARFHEARSPDIQRALERCEHFMQYLLEKSNEDRRLLDLEEIRRTDVIQYRDFMLIDQKRKKASVNEHLRILKTQWTAMQQNNVLSARHSNLWDTVRLKHSKSEEPAGRRHGFTPQDLKKFFGQVGLIDAKTNMGADEWKYWIPRIALYTGAQLHEIVHLQIKDIRQANGIVYLDINDNKTKLNARRIPIHQALSGFFLSKRLDPNTGPDQHDDHVFPGLHCHRNGKPIKHSVRRANRFFDQVGKHIDLEAADGSTAHQVHRLRHNFTACLAEQIKADVTLVKAIVGYDDHEITTGRHSGHYGLMKLYEVVQQVRFDIPG